MAESIIKVPSNSALGLDFLAFSFNGKHSWDDFGIYRVIESDRYNENLAPTLTDKTAEVPGNDGMYYFGTYHKQREFNINFAFDHLTEDKLREMKKWLNGKEMGDLWFQEAPYKVWTAKPTGNSIIKYIPFDEVYTETATSNGQIITLTKTRRIYKGEGTVQFTAYYPYAHTPDIITTTIGKVGQEYFTNFQAKYVLVYTQTNGVSVNVNGQLYINDETTPINAISTGGLLRRYYFKLADEPILITKIKFISASANVQHISFGYTSDWYENQPSLLTTIINLEGSGKNIVSYSEFGNQTEWQSSSGLADTVTVGDNPGDIPAPFVFCAPSSIDATSAPSITFQVGSLEISVPAASQSGSNYIHYNSIEWDSKTGIVSAIIDGARKPITYTGNSLGAIPIGNSLTWGKKEPDGTVSNEGYSLNYYYWYY